MTESSELRAELRARWLEVSGVELVEGRAPSAGLASEVSLFVFDRRSVLEPLLGGARPRAELATALAEDTVKSLLRRNQFAPLDRELDGELSRIFEVSLAALASAVASSVTGAALESALRRILAVQQRELDVVLAQALALPAVVSSEYSAELQLELLGLRVSDLSEPILDVGCGERALLVEYLRSEGLDVVGLDRLGSRPDVIRGEWLSFAVAPGSFGTIISHQAFSLHFLHQHLAQGDTAYRYAAKFMELLRGLRQGGVFAYVPGLPFIEQHLGAPESESAWAIERRGLPAALGRALGAAFAEVLGDVGYASRVTRLR